MYVSFRNKNRCFVSPHYDIFYCDGYMTIIMARDYNIINLI